MQTSSMTAFPTPPPIFEAMVRAAYHLSEFCRACADICTCLMSTGRRPPRNVTPGREVRRAE